MAGLFGERKVIKCPAEQFRGVKNNDDEAQEWAPCVPISANTKDEAC